MSAQGTVRGKLVICQFAAASRHSQRNSPLQASQFRQLIRYEPCGGAGAQQAPPRHISAAGQVLPHCPQFAEERFRSISHPSGAWPLQSSKPGAQETIRHRPPTHAFAALPDGVHGELQPPQFIGSVRGSTQAEPHVTSGATHGATHWFATQAELPGQTRPHWPQFEGSRSRDTQGPPPHRTWLGAQVGRHMEFTQAVPAPQGRLQPPQCRGFEVGSTQAPAHSSEPPTHS